LYCQFERRGAARSKECLRAIPKWEGLLGDGAPLFFLTGLFGAVSFNASDGALQPMLDVLAQLFFGLVGRGHRVPLPIQGDVMTGHVIGAVFFGHEIVQQAFMAGMRTGRIAVIWTAQ